MKWKVHRSGHQFAFWSADWPMRFDLAAGCTWLDFDPRVRSNRIGRTCPISLTRTFEAADRRRIWAHYCAHFAFLTCLLCSGVRPYPNFSSNARDPMWPKVWKFSPDQVSSLNPVRSCHEIKWAVHLRGITPLLFEMVESPDIFVFRRFDERINCNFKSRAWRSEWSDTSNILCPSGVECGPVRTGFLETAKEELNNYTIRVIHWGLTLCLSILPFKLGNILTE